MVYLILNGIYQSIIDTVSKVMKHLILYVGKLMSKTFPIDTEGFWHQLIVIPHYTQYLRDSFDKAIASYGLSLGFDIMTKFIIYSLPL